MIGVSDDVSAGGGPFTLGILLGFLFVAAGAGRLWFTLRRL